MGDMIQNDAIGAASLVIAKAIDERAQQLLACDYDPQRLLQEITDVLDLLYACIDPDELEQQQ